MRKEIQTKEEAIESVMRGNKTDYMLIFDFAENWVKLQFKWFSSDDLREAYYLAGNPIPEKPSVFGAVFNHLAKGKLIFHFGWTISRSERSHKRDLRTWISLEYKQRQQRNATNNNNLKLEL